MPDTIVVGAGAAGLACARTLADLGLSVALLEARDRVGGRILTIRDDGERPIEVGAQVVHGEHAATWDVIGEAGLRAIPIATDTPFAVIARGRRYTPPELVSARAALPWMVEQRLSEDGAPERPVADLLGDRDRPPSLGQLVALAWLAQVWCADPTRLSAAGMAATRGAWQSGHRDFDLPDGYDQIPRHLASGFDIHLSTPVSAIRWRAGRVTAEAGDGSWTARAAVLTMPPSVVSAGGVTFEEPLPIAKQAACDAIPMGDAVSVIATWSEPAARSGWALAADEPSGFWRVREGARPVQGWVKGPAASSARRAFKSHAAIETLATTAFPWLRGAVTDVRIVDWGTDPFASGGYCYPVAGSIDAQRTWAEPVAGTLFFAGDATTAPRHAGTVHGAIESGRRAAKQVAIALGHRTPGPG